jgi:DNA repair exonuclease SbcCD ATPase subunit
MHRHKLLVEVSELKAELQKLYSAVPQGNQAHEPCKVQCFQVEEEQKSPQQLLDSTKKVQGTKEQVQQTKSGKESVEVKADGKGELEKKLSVQEICKKSKGTWNYYQRLRDYKHKNPVCGAKKFQTFYVENLSFTAKASDIQQTVEKHLSMLSMKADSVVIARDSMGKSRGCAFITMR